MHRQWPVTRFLVMKNISQHARINGLTAFGADVEMIALDESRREGFAGRGVEFIAGGHGGLTAAAPRGFRSGDCHELRRIWGRQRADIVIFAYQPMIVIFFLQDHWHSLGM